MYINNTNRQGDMMGQITRWNEDATLQIELVVNNHVPNPNCVGHWYRSFTDITNNKDLPPNICSMLEVALIRGPLCGDEQFEDEPADLFIRFNSNGYFDPGSTYNPETAYPPEFDDERTMLEVIFQFGDDPVTVELSRGEQQKIFNHFENEVEQYEIDD